MSRHCDLCVGDVCQPGRARRHGHAPRQLPATAATVEEFGRYLRHCDPAVLAYHLARGDFSRWITGVLADHSFGMHLAAIERDLGFR